MAKAYWVVCYRSISDPTARDKAVNGAFGAASGVYSTDHRSSYSTTGRAQNIAIGLTGDPVPGEIQNTLKFMGFRSW